MPPLPSSRSTSYLPTLAAIGLTGSAHSIGAARSAIVRGIALDDRSVVGLGVDVVEKSRVRAALARWGERLVAKLMGPQEAARLPVEADARALSLARAIAAKEAASKA